MLIQNRALVMHLHPWLLFTYVTVMFAQWSVQMRIWAVEDGYQFTYGQVLEFFLAIGLQLTRNHRSSCPSPLLSARSSSVASSSNVASFSQTEDDGNSVYSRVAW
jgi:hypothetical protein